MRHLKSLITLIAMSLAVAMTGYAFDDILEKPAEQTLNVQVVSSLTGNIIANGQIVAGENNLQLMASTWESGMYLVSVLNSGTLVHAAQVVKK